MSRSIFPRRAVVTACVACAAAVLVAACAGTPVAQSDIRYDLGPATAAAASAASTAAPGSTGSRALPPLKVLDVSAPPQLDTDGIVYRLAADSQRMGRYAGSHWTTSPARLLTMRLRASLGAHATVLSGADSVSAPLLKVELDQFEQVFDGPTQSSGVLSARATLIARGKVVAQRAFTLRVPAASADAAGGVRALAAASDAFAGELGAWLGTQMGQLRQEPVALAP